MAGIPALPQPVEAGARHRTGYIILLSGIAVYLVFALWYLSLPGLQYDELLFTNAALGDVDGRFIAFSSHAASMR